MSQRDMSRRHVNVRDFGFPAVIFARDHIIIQNFFRELSIRLCFRYLHLLLKFLDLLSTAVAPWTICICVTKFATHQQYHFF